jgi:hypothetical protein
MKVRRIDFSPDEFLVGTRGMTNAEVGLYWRACSLIYSHGGPVEIAELRRWADHGRWFDHVLTGLIKAGKLTSDGTSVSNQRCISELSKAHQRSITAVSNGHQGGRPSKNINGVKNQSGSLAREPSTINHHIAPDGATPPLAVPPSSKREPQATRLADDWVPSEEDRRYAEERALDLDALAADFRDYWINKNGADGRKRDWHATWRRWCRHERQSPTPRENGYGRHPLRQATAADTLFQAAFNVAERATRREIEAEQRADRAHRLAAQPLLDGE